MNTTHAHTLYSIEHLHNALYVNCIHGINQYDYRKEKGFISVLLYLRGQLCRLTVVRSVGVWVFVVVVIWYICHTLYCELYTVGTFKSRVEPVSFLLCMTLELLFFIIFHIEKIQINYFSSCFQHTLHFPPADCNTILCHNSPKNCHRVELHCFHNDSPFFLTIHKLLDATKFNSTIGSLRQS